MKKKITKGKTMKIFKGSLTQLASQGCLTLQVPTLVIGEPVPDTEEIPDEWVMELKNDRPAVGKETGCLFLSRRGWEANKEKIKEAFEASGSKRGTWEEFEQYAEDHFEKVIAATQKFAKGLQRKADKINKVMEKILPRKKK